MQRSSWVLCAAVVLLAILRPAAGEVFLLRSGGRIEGDLVNADEEPRTSYVIALPNGGQVTLDAAVVDKVQPVRPELAEYEKVRRQYPDTVQGQLQLADWCREHKLTAQRKTHLERVLATRSRPGRRPPRPGIPQGQRPVDDARRRDGRQRLRQAIVHGNDWMSRAEAELQDSRDQATRGRKGVAQEDFHVADLARGQTGRTGREEPPRDQRPHGRLRIVGKAEEGPDTPRPG